MNLADFIRSIQDKPLEQMAREVEQALYHAERHEKAYRKRDLQRADEAREAQRLLRGISFFLHYSAKANGLSPYEFAMLEPLAVALVEQRTWEREVLDRFRDAV